MPKVKLFWDPRGRELDSLGNKKFIRITDGDTPYISMSIRMLSIDTPEIHYPGRSNPANHDNKLKQLSDWMKAGKAPIISGLSSYLHPKLATGSTGSLQKDHGDKATEEFQRLLKKKLERPGKKNRKLFIRAADEHFDHYGRLLAYISPYYTSAELSTVSYKDRVTFNLLLVESGWAASFPIYPSLPKYRDLVMLQETAEKAHTEGSGAWKEKNMLTGYEFRMCYRLWEVTNKLESGKKLSSKEKFGWVERFCVDMTTLAIYEPQEYYKVKPYNRIFIWPEDVNEAVGKLNLSVPD